MAIEKVQRRATKHLTYTERMEILLLPSLKYRRIRGDMILVYKIMNGLVDIDWINLFTLTRSEITRGSKHKLFIELYIVELIPENILLATEPYLCGTHYLIIRKLHHH